MAQPPSTRFIAPRRELRRVRRLRAVAGALVFVAVACAREQHVPAAGQRIVSLAPSITDLLFAIGAGPGVVGRTRWAAYPPEALAVPSVGDGLDPNVEAIAARRPDLVLFYESPANATAVQQLTALGISTESLRMDRLDDVARAARRFGAVTGTAAHAESLATRFTERLDSARAARSGAPPGPRVLILSWDQPPIVIGGGSFQSELLELAGARNAFGDLAQPSGQVAIETIAARDPDLVLLTGGASDPEWAARAEWQVVPAVRARRFVVVSTDAFTYPSFRAFEAVAALRRALERGPP